MTNNYKYGVEPKELKEIRKYIIADIKSDNKVENPIHQMTLQDYLDAIKEFMLGLCDENGKVIDFYGGWKTSKYEKDLRLMSAKEVAEDWMDGRGLFSEHFNSQLLSGEKHYGDWKDIDQHEQNQWYHEDRLNDPLWFKECVMCIGHAGHPTETLKAGNLNPIYFNENDWYLSFGTFSRGDWACLKGYYHMKKKGLPVFIYAAQSYLTPKQIKQLQEEGYLKNKDYRTGYYR